MFFEGSNTFIATTSVAGQARRVLGRVLVQPLHARLLLCCGCAVVWQRLAVNFRILYTLKHGLGFRV